jgi:hypothetical protein
LRRTVQLLRDAWIVAGLSLALLVALEVAYRTEASVSRTLSGARQVAPEISPEHPNAREQWWTDIFTLRDSALTGKIRYDPFRGWWPLEHHSRAINVDSNGLRVTVQPRHDAPVVSSSRPLVLSASRSVYLLGGSVMWGWVVRDSFTIPSRVAAELHRRGYRDVEVVNLAQSMFDLAQGLATLTRELRLGRVPAVAVFLDGNNEIAPPRQSGDLGRVLNEALLADRFARTETLGRELLDVVRRSELVRRVSVERITNNTGTASLCDAIAASYHRQTQVGTAAARAFGFDAVFLWQPMLATSAKRRTSWERTAARDTTWGAMVRRCTAVVDSTMRADRAVRFASLSTLFDSDTTDVFLDDFGHMTERANGVVAGAIADHIAQRLGPPRR